MRGLDDDSSFASSSGSSCLYPTDREEKHLKDGLAMTLYFPSSFCDLRLRCLSKCPINDQQFPLAEKVIFGFPTKSIPTYSSTINRHRLAQATDNGTSGLVKRRQVQSKPCSLHKSGPRSKSRQNGYPRAWARRGPRPRQSDGNMRKVSRLYLQ